MDNPPKTPPAWFAMYQRRQEEHETQIQALKSADGATLLAVTHIMKKQTELIEELMAHIKEKLP